MAERLAQGRPIAELVPEIQPRLDILFELLAQRPARLRRKNIEAQVSGADGVGLIDGQTAPQVVLRIGRREREGHEKPQKGKQGAFHNAGPRCRGLAMAHALPSAVSVTQEGRAEHGQKQEAHEGPDHQNVVHRLSLATAPNLEERRAAMRIAPATLPRENDGGARGGLLRQKLEDARSRTTR